MAKYVLENGEVELIKYFDEANITKKEETMVPVLNEASAPTEAQFSALMNALEALKALERDMPKYPDTLAESVAEALSDIDDALCGEGWEATR